MENDILLEKRTLVHKGSILDYYEDIMSFPNGNKATWDYIEHKPVVAFFPVDVKTGKILCVKQYRHAIESESIEIPAGGINDNETPFDGAIRELSEETGYECVDSDASAEVSKLIEMYTSVGYTNEKIYIFYGNVVKKRSQSLDENEYVNIILLDKDEIRNMILNGEIKDGKTIAAFFAYSNIV